MKLKKYGMYFSFRKKSIPVERDQVIALLSRSIHKQALRAGIRDNHEKFMPEETCS